jgi:hypothetical protein
MLRLLLILAACSGTAVDPGRVPVDDTPFTPDERVALWPRVPALPVNGLRFELVCTEPMGLTSQRVRVFDELGDELPGSVRSLRWDRDLNLGLFEPKGLAAGRAYTLRVSGLATATGDEIPEQRYRVVVGDPDELAPDGKLVRVSGDTAEASSGEVQVAFPEPITRGSLASLTVLQSGSRVPGQWTLGESQLVASFAPADPWSAGPVHVSLAAGIVDLAGNELANRPEGFLVPSGVVTQPGTDEASG